MEAGKLIKILCITEEVSMTELAQRLNISRQALYKRLEGGMRYENFVECMEALGYTLYYGKEGKVKKLE